MSDIPSSVLDDPHVQQELRRILLKNAFSADVSLNRASSTPASIDGLLQRQTDVDYDQRSRFASLGASPSDGFLQDACFNRDESNSLMSYLQGSRQIGASGGPQQLKNGSNIQAFWAESGSQGVALSNSTKGMLNGSQTVQGLDAFLQAAYSKQDQAPSQGSQAQDAGHHSFLGQDLSVSVPRDSLSWQESATDVIGSAFSSPRRMNNVLGGELQFSSVLQALPGLASSGADATDAELFGSAANSPRSHVSDIGMGGAFKNNDGSLLPGRHNLFKDPKVSLSSLVGSSTPKAVERHGPSKLRIGSNNNYLDPAPDALSSASQQAIDAPQLQQRGPYGPSGPAAPGIGETAFPYPHGSVNVAYGTAGQGGSSSSGSSSSGSQGAPQPPAPTPQQLHSMYMAAAAMYPYYVQHGTPLSPGPPVALPPHSPTTAAFQSYMLSSFPPFSYPYLYGHQPDSAHSPAMPPHQLPFPPMPFPHPEYAREYAAYYHKCMEAHAAAAMHHFPRPAAAMAMAAAAAAAAAASTDLLTKEQQQQQQQRHLRDMAGAAAAAAAQQQHSYHSSSAAYGHGSSAHSDMRRSQDGGASAPAAQQRSGSSAAAAAAAAAAGGARRRKPSASGAAGGAPARSAGAGDAPARTAVPSPAAELLLDEFKSNRNRRFEVRDILGHLLEFALDQHGSRFLQQKLETLAPEDYEAALQELLPRTLSLVSDVFGNYVVQKFLEHGSTAARRALCEQLAGHALQLSLHMYGCRVVQKAVEVAPLAQQLALVSELEAHVMRCVKDQNGNHVVQKVIECVPSDKIAPVIDTFLGSVVPLSTHPFGCRVVQRVLEHCSDAKKRKIAVDEILRATVQLSQDTYGNYVIQHVLQHGLPEERRAVVRALVPQVVALSQHKFASNVVEKCLVHAAPEERGEVVAAMLGPDGGGEADQPLHAMMRDQFGNYVVQRLLEVCDEAQRDMLLQRVRAQLHSLKKFTYGKHIVARVEKLLSTGTKMQNSARLRSLQLSSQQAEEEAELAGADADAVPATGAGDQQR